MFEKLFGSKPVDRSAEAQGRIDEQLKKMQLFQFKSCPYCVKVRRAMVRLNMDIELRDTRKNPDDKAALLAGGGKTQVPCLRIEHDDGRVEWMYESADIVAFLEKLSADAG